MEEPGRGFYISLIGSIAVVYVAIILYFEVLLDPVGAVDDVGLAIALLVCMVVFAAALAADRFAGRAGPGVQTVDWRLTAKLGISAGIGLIAVALTSSVAFSGAAFGYSYYGFPLTSTVVACGEGPFTRCVVTSSPLPFFVNYVFWAALVYPAVSLVDSARVGALRDLSRLVAIGVTALLSMGTLAATVALAALDITSVNAVLGYLGPGLYPALTFLPNALLGAILLRAGAKGLGLTVVLSGLTLLVVLVLAMYVR